MDIAKTFLKNFVSTIDFTSKVSQGSSSGNSNFNSFLDSAKGTNQNTNSYSNKNNSKVSNSKSSFENKNNLKSDSKNYQNSNEDVKRINDDNSKSVLEENNKISDDKSKVDNFSNSDENTNSSENSEELKKVAEVLGISVEELQQILNQLNMNLVDLQNHDSLLKFVQCVMNVENPIELLSIDGIKDTISKIKELVSNMDMNDLNSENINTLNENANFEFFGSKDNTTEVLNQNEQYLENDDLLLNSENTSIKEIVNSNNSSDKSNSDLEVNENIDIQEENKISNNSLQGFSTNSQSGKNSFSGSGLGNSENQLQNSSNNNMNNNLNPINNSVDSFDAISKAFSKTMSKAEASRNVNTTDVINQIIEKMKVGIIKENVSELRLTLRPDYLGEVALKISSENGIITAQFKAENQRVKEIIESNFNELKDMLNEQGIEVSELSVSVGEDRQNQPMQQFMLNQQKSEKRINGILSREDDFVNSEDDKSDILETENAVQYVDAGEGVVLETSVNYIA